MSGKGRPLQVLRRSRGTHSHVWLIPKLPVRLHNLISQAIREPATDDGVPDLRCFLLQLIEVTVIDFLQSLLDLHPKIILTKTRRIGTRRDDKSRRDRETSLDQPTQIRALAPHQGKLCRVVITKTNEKTSFLSID